MGGAIRLVLAHHILREYGSNAIGFSLAGLAAVSALCSAALPETRARRHHGRTGGRPRPRDDGFLSPLNPSHPGP